MSYAVPFVAAIMMVALYVAIPEAHHGSVHAVAFSGDARIPAGALVHPGHPLTSAPCPFFTTFHDWTDDDGRRERSQCYEAI